MKYTLVNCNWLYLHYFFTKSYVLPLVRIVSMRRFLQVVKHRIRWRHNARNVNCSLFYAFYLELWYRYTSTMLWEHLQAFTYRNYSNKRPGDYHKTLTSCNWGWAFIRGIIFPWYAQHWGWSIIGIIDPYQLVMCQYVNFGLVRGMFFTGITK